MIHRAIEPAAVVSCGLRASRGPCSAHPTAVLPSSRKPIPFHAAIRPETLQLTDQGAFKLLIKEALKKKVTAFFQIELRGEFLWVEPVEETEEYADKCDGKLALQTDNPDLSAMGAYRSYKDMQEIERSWRALKSSLRIRPNFHWTEQRVRAHTLLCVLALVVERVMRLKLKSVRSDYSPQSALAELRKLTHVTLQLPGDKKRWDLLANKTPEQLQLFRELEVDPLTDARLRQLVS